MKEKELLLECKQGNAKAQKLLFDSFADQVYRISFRYTGIAMDAEDVMMSAFYKVFKHLNLFEYRGEGSFSKWINTIVINEALVFLRNSNRFRFEEFDEIHIQIPTDFECSIDSKYIYDLIMNLPDGYRTVVNLYIIDGLSHDEIASQLGISVNTSKSQLSRARAVLKEQILKLENYGK